MQRHIAIASAAGLIATVVLAGCGEDAAGEDANSARGPITIWYSNNAEEVAWGEQMVAAWNEAHPEEAITAQEIPAGRSSEEVITAAITAGNAPCLILNTAPAAVPEFQRQGGLVALDSFPDATNYIETRTGAAAAQYQSPDGQYYQLPWKANPVVLFYNKELFEEAGLDPDNPPLRTYDEFLATARTVVDGSSADAVIWPAPTSEFFQSWFDFYPLYAAQTGGMQLVAEGTATFDSDAGRAVAGFWRNLYAEGLAGQEQYQGDAFADGKSAMSIVGPWAIAVYEDVDWGWAPVPTSAGTDPAQTWTFSDAKNMAMYSACQNRATAWDVMTFATSQEQDGVFLEMTGQMPMRANLAAAYPDYFAANPAYEAFADQAARTVEVPNVPNSIEVWQTFRDAYTESVIFGRSDPAAALTDAAGQINELVGE
jgi:multiple sugar transport system substrate-binding protein